MTEEEISTIQEDITKDFSEIAACHQEEVNPLMQAIWQAWHRHSCPIWSLWSQMAKTNSWTRPSTEPEQQMEESDDDDEQEPSMFDILDDDAEEDPEDDVPEDQQA